MLLSSIVNRQSSVRNPLEAFCLRMALKTAVEPPPGSDDSKIVKNVFVYSFEVRREKCIGFAFFKKILGLSVFRHKSRKPRENLRSEKKFQTGIPHLSLRGESENYTTTVTFACKKKLIFFV